MSSRLEFLIRSCTLYACEKLLPSMNEDTTSGIPPTATYSLNRERNFSLIEESTAVSESNDSRRIPTASSP